jgi:hypothetical protein
VDHDRRAVAVGQRLDAQQRLRPDRVGGVRTQRRDDQRIARPLLQERLGGAQALVGVLQARHGLVHHRGRAEAAQPGRLRGLRDLVLVEVHVGEGGGAGADHLPRREARAPLHELGRHVQAFRRPDVLRQPDHQLHVVGHAAQQRHRDVRVRVDEAGHHDAARGVDRLRGGEARRELAGGAHGHDALAAHGHGAVLHHAEAGVHGDDRSAREQQVHGLAGARPGSGQLQDHGGRQQQRHTGLHGGQY